MRYKIIKNKQDKYQKSQMHQFIDKNRFNKIAEIGVFKGEFFDVLVKSSALEIVAIDPWDRIDISTVPRFCGNDWKLTTKEMGSIYPAFPVSSLQ